MKHYVSLKNKITPDKIKVVTVMPCYDKKLEAVRPNFTLHEDINSGDEENEVKEVDTVLATHELVDLIEKQYNSYEDI